MASSSAAHAAHAAAHTLWHIPDRGTGTPDFTLSSASASSSSSSEQRRPSPASHQQQQHTPHFTPRLNSIPSASCLLLTPAPRHGTTDGITLNNDSPPLSPTATTTDAADRDRLPLFTTTTSPSSTPAPAAHHHHHHHHQHQESTWWNSLIPHRNHTPHHHTKKHAVLITHSRRRSEPVSSAASSSTYFDYEKGILHLSNEDEDEEDDDDDDAQDPTTTLLSPYEDDGHHLLAPPRSASAAAAAAAFWRSSSSSSASASGAVTLSPSPAPSHSSSTSSASTPAYASSSSSSSPQPQPSCAAAPARRGSLRITTANIAPFTSFFGLRERSSRNPALASNTSPASSSSSFFGALYSHRSRRGSSFHTNTNTSSQSQQQHRRAADSLLSPPSPCSPTIASSHTSALGARFRWRSHRTRSPRTGEEQRQQRPRAVTAHPRLDRDSITWAQRALPYLPALIVLAAIFLVSTICLVFALSTLPVRLPPLSVPSSSLNGSTLLDQAAAERLTREHSNSFTYRLTHLTLADIRAVTTSLKEYARTGKAALQEGAQPDVDELVAGPLGLGFAKLHILLVLSALFTWKQAFTIPGSIIMNVIFGALYGTFWGTIYTSLLTAFGGLCCYLLCSPLGGLIAALPGLKKPLHAIRTALDPDAASAVASAHDGATLAGGAYRDDDVEERSAAAAHRPRPHPRPSLLTRSSSTASFTLGSSGSAAFSSLASRARLERVSTSHWYSLGSSTTWSYLLLLRLLPIIPYGLTNIACSVLRTPLLPFVCTLGLGSVPWNVLTCQVGELLEEVLSVALEVAASSEPGLGVVGVSGGVGAGVNASQGALAGVKAIVSQVLWKRETMLKLGLVSLASLAPVFLGRVLRGKTTTPSPSTGLNAASSRTPSVRRGVLFGQPQHQQRRSSSQQLQQQQDGTTEPLLEMDALADRRPSSNDDDDHSGGWISSATAPLHPLIRPPPIAAPAPQHRPWWLLEDGAEEMEGEEGSASNPTESTTTLLGGARSNDV
ncbi:hypothetical protein OC844_003214 [Tilletia horrida]|nr:hypothetical protein OC844_003214 [Tilletia horrida]